MSWFSRRGGATTDAPPPGHNEPSSGDRALDTLAAVVRSYGEHGFDTQSMTAQELSRRCDAWARHVTNGTPAPVGGDEEQPGGAGAVPMDRRAWADLQMFLATHRREEQRDVIKSAEGLRNLVGEMTRGLREAMVDDGNMDERVTRYLSGMHDTVQRGTLSDIRAEFPKIAQAVTDVLSARRSRYELQLASLGALVHDLRAELMAARSEARLDALTQLHNRGAFDDVLNKQVDYAFLSGEPLALVLLDLDEFKAINDAHGHPGGDAVLRRVADAMVRMLPRSTDFIARFGGEEFAVILMEFDPARLEGLVNRLLAAVRDLEVAHEGAAITLTTSAGVAVYSRSDSSETLIARADRALYKAKADGRNRAVIDASG